MKSFDARLENDLFPKTPAAFDQMVKQKIADVCSRTEESKKTEELEETVTRFQKVGNGKQRTRKAADFFRRFGIAAIAAVFVIGIVAVGLITILPRTTGTSHAAQPGLCAM